MGRELDEALARRRRKHAREATEERLRSIPGVEFLGFDEDPALPDGRRACRVGSRLDAEFDAELSSETPRALKVEWLAKQLDRAHVGGECFLFTDREVPWARARVEPSGWLSLLEAQQTRDFLAFGSKAGSKLLHVIDDWHERRLLALTLDPREYGAIT